MTPEAASRVEMIGYVFIITGVFTILVTMGNVSRGAITGNIVGFSALLAGTLVLLSQRVSGGGNVAPLSISAILLVGALVFNIVTISLYFKPITQNSVPAYASFSLTSVSLIGAQLYLMFRAAPSAMNRQMGIMFGLLNSIASTTLYLIARYYPTDC
jgi:hypothetical protein